MIDEERSVKKLRDKERKREQARRSKAREQQLHQQIKLQAKHVNASMRWHFQESREEELRIKRYELDIVNPYQEHPASAGYVMTKASFNSLERQCDAFNPIFFGYSYARGEFVNPFESSFVFDERRKHPKHPACQGYSMSRHLCTNISPIFINMDFRKRGVDESVDGDMAEMDEEKKSHRITQKEAQDLQQILQARFDMLLVDPKNTFLVL